ncbi:TetR family transcriptional regulator [Mycolicibacterium agri]|uniref:TetR family transcriptional regulator n=1 Tax=Mycolicibacterium agri TaxID=36811 RepID=A0A2A7N7W3_MYCAG|nr:TetR/AcrR family transcriptional regulator [Mycolicibacterium agri]PEG39538.1 TetR family transcriptional regulator [Mycolicibacterium agri]GFG48624.1 TetR family transcriptional regulator [Mycolicibacterium agri]
MATEEGRTFTPKGRATRERILQAAASIVLDEGLSDLSLDKVRQRASVSGSQLSHYYSDKQALLRAVLERQIEVVLEFHRQPQLRGLNTFDDFERWLVLNLRYLRKIGYRGTPTYHALAGRLIKSDDATRQTLEAGYARWVELLEESFGRMKDRGVLVTAAQPRELAYVVVGGHQAAGTLTYAYREEWPLAETLRFVVNYLRLFAADPTERMARRTRRPRGRRVRAAVDGETTPTFTRKGLATRARIVNGAAHLMFERGVHATSLDDVRRVAGVSGSQLTHYFGDKRDLIRQVIAARAKDVVDLHAQPVMGQFDSYQALRSWADACIADIDSVYLHGGCIYGSLTAELLEADSAVLDDLAEGYDRWLELFQNGLKQMRRRGELTDGADPRHLAVALVAAHQGGTMLTFISGTAEPFLIMMEAALRYVNSFRMAPTTRATRVRSRSKNRT